MLTLTEGSWFLSCDDEDALRERLEATAGDYEADEFAACWSDALDELGLDADLEPSEADEALFDAAHRSEVRDAA